jgi:hypothetical protein
MTAGGNEIVNVRRLQAYFESVGSPFTTGPQVCGCDTLTPSNLGAEDANGDPVTAYTTPALDPAPWVDSAIPESSLFLGFMPLTMEGIDGSTRTRSVTNAVGGGGVFGPSRELPRTITVTGLLIGASCCAADYGLHWLEEALLGCEGDACNGSCVELFNCCPDTILTKTQLDAAHRRTFMRAALVSGPTVTARVGTGGACSRGTCGMNGDIIQVEFILTAASPTPWTDPIPLLDVGWPIGGSGDCVDWCLQNLDPMDCYEWDFTNSGACVWDTTGPNPCLDIVEDPTCPQTDCAHAPCVSGADKCADPLVQVMAPPVPTAPTSPFCIPLAPERACYSIDLSTRPEWAVDVPIITITAGVTDLRNVGITLYGKPSGTPLTCDQIADQNRCNPLTDFFVSFIPAGSSVTIDGRTGRATTDCNGECNTASTVFGGIDGGPIRFEELDCAAYCVCLTSDPAFPPGADATMSLSISGKGY